MLPGKIMNEDRIVSRWKKEIQDCRLIGATIANAGTSSIFTKMMCDKSSDSTSSD